MQASRSLPVLGFLLLLLLGASSLAGCGSGGDPKCDGVFCGQNGTCVDGKCQCATGYGGSYCQTCFPRCTGKECGDDGCGGSCGSCTGGACNNGTCGCAPQCSGKQCGNDGCGGSCGTCQTGVCSPSGQCCTPNCAGKSCGLDGCGGLCGKCSGLEACINGGCTIDSGLACVERPNTCDNDGDCGGPPMRCLQAPVLSCGLPPTDCGTADTICRSVNECWQSCSSDTDCPAAKPKCVDSLCHSCRQDSDCTGGLFCINSNARDRCASAGDCNLIAVNECR